MFAHPAGHHRAEHPLRQAVKHRRTGLGLAVALARPGVEVRHQRRAVADALVPLLVLETLDEIAEARRRLQVAHQRQGWHMDLERAVDHLQVQLAGRAGVESVLVAVSGGERQQHQDAVNRHVGGAVADD